MVISSCCAAAERFVSAVNLHGARTRKTGSRESEGRSRDLGSRNRRRPGARLQVSGDPRSLRASGGPIRRPPGAALAMPSRKRNGQSPPGATVGRQPEPVWPFHLALRPLGRGRRPYDPRAESGRPRGGDRFAPQMHQTRGDRTYRPSIGDCGTRGSGARRQPGGPLLDLLRLPAGARWHA
jgi:hypothetical protein